MFARAKASGWPTALMSPVPGSARPSSFTSLRRPPAVLGGGPCRQAANKRRRVCSIGLMRRSAQSRTGIGPAGRSAQRSKGGGIARQGDAGGHERSRAPRRPDPAPTPHLNGTGCPVSRIARQTGFNNLFHEPTLFVHRERDTSTRSHLETMPAAELRQPRPARGCAIMNFCMSHAPVGQRSAHRPQCRQTSSSLTITRPVFNSPET